MKSNGSTVVEPSAAEVAQIYLRNIFADCVKSGRI